MKARVWVFYVIKLKSFYSAGCTLLHMKIGGREKSYKSVHKN